MVRRRQLVRELWRLRLTLISSDSSTHPGPDSSLLGRAMGSESHSHARLQADLELKSALHSLLRRLDVDDLENLLEAIRSRGATPSNQCVLLPQSSAPALSTSPSLASSSYEDLPVERLALKAWRWHDLCSMDVIKFLPHCKHGTEAKMAEDQHYTCINPYHWSRVILTGQSSLSLYYQSGL